MGALADRQRGGASDARERLLVAAVAGEDRDALGELYREYHPRIFKFVFRLVRNYDIAEELVNDVMLCIWRGASRFRGSAKVSTWVFGIAYRQAMRRVAKKELKTVDDFDPDQAIARDVPNVEREDWVRSAIDALPSVQRAAVILVFYLGLTYEEAAEIADCPVNTIKTRMFHARRKLRDALGGDAEVKVQSDD